MTHHPNRFSAGRIMLLTTARSYLNQAFMDAAERLNIQVIPVQNMVEELAEHWGQTLGVDFNYPDRAAQTIAGFASRTPVDAIRAVDDSGTLVAAKASALLGLPHNSPRAACAARDKYHMRTLFTQAGVACPRFQRFSTEQDVCEVATEVDYPCVVKPLNLSGSRGVIRANNNEEFVVAVQRLVRILATDQSDLQTYSYLVEEFIPGREIALEGMLDQGELTVLALFDKPDPLDGPFFEETIYVTPSRLPDAVQSAIARCAADSAAALGLCEGPIHAEMRVNEEGPWILEVAGRSIGGLCSQTLRFGSDVSLEELILRQACGLEIDGLQRHHQANGVMMIPIPEAGILKGIDGVDKAKAIATIEDIQITAKLNYSLVPLPEGESYLGFIFARSNTPSEVEAALRQAHSKLKFHIVPELNLSMAL